VQKKLAVIVTALNWRFAILRWTAKAAAALTGICCYRSCRAVILFI
jgi:hypothetical protein